MSQKRGLVSCNQQDIGDLPIATGMLVSNAEKRAMFGLRLQSRMVGEGRVTCVQHT